MNEVKKPIIVERVEFVNKLSAMINNSCLPTYVIEPILSAALRDVRAVMKQQYDAALEEYERATMKDISDKEQGEVI